jgi:hypothetical protein
MNMFVFTYLMSKLFMNINAQREVRKATMALAPNVASKKVYCTDLPQGL